MSTGRLPEPIPPGPVPGEPGHFADHDWLRAAIAELDRRLVKTFATTAVISCQPSTYTPVVWDAVRVDTGLDISAPGTGGVLMGPGAPAGLYRLDMSYGFANNANGSRLGRLMVNGAEDLQFRLSSGGYAGTIVLHVSGIIDLAAESAVVWEIFQGHTAAVNSSPNHTKFHMEYLGEPVSAIEES